jgi:hypothetical protein
MSLPSLAIPYSLTLWLIVPILDTLSELQFIIENDSGGNSDVKLIFWFIAQYDPEIKSRIKRE